jgi:hypothetical protein
MPYSLEQPPPHDPKRKPFEPYGLQWQHDTPSGCGPIFFWWVVLPSVLLSLAVSMAMWVMIMLELL